MLRCSQWYIIMYLTRCVPTSVCLLRYTNAERYLLMECTLFSPFSPPLLSLSLFTATTILLNLLPTPIIHQKIPPTSLTYGHMPSVDTPPNVGSCLGPPRLSTSLLRNTNAESKKGVHVTVGDSTAPIFMTRSDLQALPTVHHHCSSRTNQSRCSPSKPHTGVRRASFPSRRMSSRLLNSYTVK